MLCLAYPIIGEKSAAEITSEHILAILQPIWTEKTETAARVRGRIEAVLDWEKVMKYRSSKNPAIWKGNLEIALPSQKKVKFVVHLAAMHYKNISEFFHHLQIREVISAHALELAILNASRSSELRFATWKEIDFDEKLWIIPASCMKGGKTHRIPLTSQSILLLKNLPRFQSDREKQITFFHLQIKKKSHHFPMLQ